jgi:dTMP kinase
MAAYKGKFITFEGGDGAGKTTQVKLLAAALEKTGVSVVTTREPGGTLQAERIRDLLLQRDSGNFEPMTEALLLFAARREHLTQKIWPAMEKGAFVISDRFADSTRAFQGAGMGLDLRVINDLYKTVVGDFAPDLTFVFDIDPEVGLARSAARQTAVKNTEDRYERMGVDFQKRLRQGFLDIARAEPKRCVVINAARAVDDIHAEIIGIVSARLSLSVQKVANG